MFRALTCPSSGGKIVLTKHLVSSLSVNVCTVHWLRADSCALKLVDEIILYYLTALFRFKTTKSLHTPNFSSFTSPLQPTFTLRRPAIGSVPAQRQGFYQCQSVMNQVPHTNLPSPRHSLLFFSSFQMSISLKRNTSGSP